ncbi:MAG: SurA N-terminal domain-containing protein [Bosea sp. (in: a-proteobacteria)]
MRKAGQSFIGKIVIFVLFGFLIFSFAIWGIGDIFRGYGRNTVAKIGKTEIGIEQLRSSYQNEVQTMSRQQRRSISPDVARALGLDRQVLSKLVTEAAMDQTVGSLGLAISDATIREVILEAPEFRGPSGTFDRNRFNELIRSNGFTEQSFVTEQRRIILRQQLAEAVAGGVTAPVALQEVGHRLRSEVRAISYIMLPAAGVGAIEAPTEAQLQAYFDERKATFRAPDYRSANVMALTPAMIATPDAVTEADVLKRYDEVKAQRFGTPERRTLQQIAFPSLAEAEAGLARLKAGETFEVLATSRNVSEKDLLLGTFSRAQMIDQLVADAAFALAEGAVSAPVQSPFGVVLVRASRIEREQVRPLTEVAATLRQEIATSRARERLTAIFNTVEDQRAGAKPLAEIAKDAKLSVTSIGPVDRFRQFKDGTATPTLPGLDLLVDAMFKSDIGVDNEAVRLASDGGYLWFDVSAVEPSRERTFAESRAEVERQWRSDELANRLQARSRELAQRLDKGETLEAVAASAGLPVQNAEALNRQSETAELPRNVITIVFGTPVGKTGTASLPGDAGRIILQVKSAAVPPFVRTTQEADNFARRLDSSMSEDLMAQYVGRLQTDLGLTINRAAFRNATGASGN